MKVDSGNVRMLAISEADRLDPIDVFIVNYAPGKGRITIRCWDRAWTCAWFAMGETTIEKFFASADWDYIASNLTQGLHGMRKDAKKDDAPYLRRIIETVQMALREGGAL